MSKLNLDRPLADSLRQAAVDRLTAVWGEGPLGRLVARVAVLLAEDDAWPELTSKIALQKLFRTAGLIPPMLVAQCQEHSLAEGLGAGMPADQLAANFAVCLFPQRAFQLEPAELAERLALWLPALHQLRKLTCGDEDDCLGAAALVPALAPFVSAAESCFSELITDLAGASLLESHSAPGSPGRQEWLDRRLGAVLHLATCKAESIPPMLARHRQLSAPLRCLRHRALSLPSRLVLAERSRDWPSWHAVVRGLGEIFPGESSDTLAMIVRLERMTWDEARQWVRPGLVEERCEDFWELTWAKLAAGFPYFSFRASLATWWKQCLSRFPFSSRNKRQSLDDDSAPVPAGALAERDATTAEAPSLEQLRAWRELYRVVRSTFYAEKPTEPATDNERYRRVVDALWRERIVNQVEGDLPRTLLKTLQDRFPDVTADMLVNLSHRLRMRFYAARLARYRRLSIAAIRSAPPEDALRHAVDSAVRPLAEVAGIDSLVAIVKAAAPEYTLLGPLTAQFAFGTLASPRWKDPWTFSRYVGELWSWTGLGNLAEQEWKNSALEAATREIRSSPEWQSLLQGLQAAASQEQVDALVNSSNWKGPEQIARQALARAFDQRALDAFQPKRVSRWRKLAKEHWFVPVWYLTVIERLEQEELLARLVVDVHEVDGIVALHRAMAEDCLPRQQSSN